MANPQVEDGYTRIANELLEALARIRIPGEAMQITLTVLRQTYGFQKKTDAISLDRFCLATGLKKSNCVRAIRKSLAMNLIIRTDNNRVPKYSINKDFETWKPLSEGITVIRTDNKSLSARRTIHINKERKERCDSDESFPSSPEKTKTTDPRIRSIIDFFHTTVLTEKGFAPVIDAVDAKAVKNALKSMPQEDIENAIKFYVGSQKAKEHGPTLSIALSKHSLNLFKENWQKVKWQYEG